MSKTRKIAAMACLLVSLGCVIQAFVPGNHSLDTVRTAEAAVASAPAKSIRTRPIEEIRPGMRVVGRNPVAEDAVRGLPDPDPETWRLLDISLVDGGGKHVDVQLLRPFEWIEERQLSEGSEFWLELPEMHAAGRADVRSISECPPIERANGSVVTGTFRHIASQLIEVKLNAYDEPLLTTPEHPFWAPRKREFVPARALKVGTWLNLSLGNATVRSVRPTSGDACVYGIEVYGEHVYRVGTGGALVHNSSVRPNSPNHVASLPFGYKEKPFRRFVQRTNEEFAGAGFEDAKFFMQGSAASGRKFSGELLDARKGIKPSDYDVAVVSPQLIAKAKELGINVLGGPLKGADIAALGLSEAQVGLTKASKGGIPVNFKVYESIDDVYQYDATIAFEQFGG